MSTTIATKGVMSVGQYEAMVKAHRRAFVEWIERLDRQKKRKPRREGVTPDKRTWTKQGERQ